MKKWLLEFIEYVAVCILIGELVYGDCRAGVFFLAGLPVFLKFKKKKRLQEEIFKQSIQFKDALLGLRSALEAGYSLENSVREAYREMISIYGKEQFICSGFEIILREIENGISVEDAFLKFAAKCKLEDARNFAEMIAATKRTGGDLIKVMASCAGVIAAKFETSREIRTVTAQKRLEGKIMVMVPPAMICYFRLFSPGLLTVLYEGTGGRALMTVLLAIYIGMVFLMMHITEIKV